MLSPSRKLARSECARACGHCCPLLLPKGGVCSMLPCADVPFGPSIPPPLKRKHGPIIIAVHPTLIESPKVNFAQRSLSRALREVHISIDFPPLKLVRCNNGGFLFGNLQICTVQICARERIFLSHENATRSAMPGIECTRSSRVSREEYIKAKKKEEEDKKL